MCGLNSYPLPNSLLFLPHFTSRSLLFSHNQSIPGPRFSSTSDFYHLLFSPQSLPPILSNYKNRRRNYVTLLRASRRESPYEVLGVSPSATPDDIKRAYRKLALKFHPDVNKEPNAQEKFMRIKHAYNTLLNSESRRKYDTGKSSGFSYNETNQTRNSPNQEEFYGFGDFFRDLQEEYQNWEASASSQGKPKSLWEELAEIGEEFVEFLEKELNISDGEIEENNNNNNNNGFQSNNSYSGSGTKSAANVQNGKGNSLKDSIDEIEATLAQLKKELGL